MYYGLSTASEVFHIFTTQLYQYFSVFFLFALLSDEPEVFLPKYSQTAKLNAAHFRRVVDIKKHIPGETFFLVCVQGEKNNYFISRYGLESFAEILLIRSVILDSNLQCFFKVFPFKTMKYLLVV